MGKSYLCDIFDMPDEGMAAAVLADTYPLWEELYNHVLENYPNIIRSWKHYGKNSGWHLKLLHKKRNLFFFTPLDGCFKVGFIFGDKAAARIEAEELPDEIKKSLRAAIRYSSGRGIDIEIKYSEQLDVVKKLLRIKFEN